MANNCLLLGFILIVTVSEGLAAFRKDPACTNDVDNTEEKYMPNEQGGCSILHPDPVLADMDITAMHESCYFTYKKVSECQEACDKDENCKGFAERIEQDNDGSVTGKKNDWYSQGCMYATSGGESTCLSSGGLYFPSDMEESGGLTTGNIGIGNLLGSDYGTHYCGCWRKASFVEDW